MGVIKLKKEITENVIVVRVDYTATGAWTPEKGQNFISASDKVVSVASSAMGSAEEIKALEHELRCLEKRVEAIERGRRDSRMKTVASMQQEGNHFRQAYDTYAINMLIRALSAGFTDTVFVRCPDDYYDWEVSKRREFLKAPSTKHLTKSIVFENTRYGGDEEEEDREGGEESSKRGGRLDEWRYVCCVVGYGEGVDTELLKKLARESGADRNGVPASASKFNFRVASDCLQITGYERNAVTPLGLRTQMGVVLDDKVDKLEPRMFWLGGGRVSLKWMVTVDEFRAAFKPLVARISTC